MRRTLISLLLGVVVALPVLNTAASETVPGYDELRRQFESPDHARWGEVPLWWWEGDPMTRERVTWQLETLAARGVKSVCPIQRSPGRCQPQSFDDDWWEMFAFVNEECKRLGMTLWAYDQVGYGHYGWLEKAAAKVKDARTSRLSFITAEGVGGTALRLELPEGVVIGARAYPLRDGIADDGASVDLGTEIKGRTLSWTPPEGTWRVAVSVAAPFQSFYLSDTAAAEFVDIFYGKIERTLGKESMGTSFVGIFQDEHPPTPRDIYTAELAEKFQARHGYPLARALPAQHFDVGPLTPRYRTDFFDTYLDIVESTYWKRVYDWTWDRNLLTSHDNWGRNNIQRQSQGYIDYFRTERWFSAPGYDDAGQRPLTQRNYYDTKIAASIARLYARPRVWNEAFHSSGWGRTTEQTLAWLSSGYAYGANLYDEHGLYYSTRASTWEHAAPDPHWRQPYWHYYGTLSDWVARSSYLMSQGVHVVDVAVHYPVVSLLAGEPPGTRGPDYNKYISLSKTIYDAGIDNDIVDDDSILGGVIKDGTLIMGGNAYRALVFGPETTMRRAVFEKAIEFAHSGGTLLFYERLPSVSTEGGRDDPKLKTLLLLFLGPRPSSPSKDAVGRSLLRFRNFVRSDPGLLPRIISESIDRDFVPSGGRVAMAHRRIDDIHVYLLQNLEDGPIDLEARCRVDGVPELWNPTTGGVEPVERFSREGGHTKVSLRLVGNTVYFLVFKPGEEKAGERSARPVQPAPRLLSEDWEFSVIPTRDNRWGEFRWPPSDEVIGPEVRTMQYMEETDGAGKEKSWHRVDFDAGSWPKTLSTTGPRWLFLAPLAAGDDIARTVLVDLPSIRAGASLAVAGKKISWRELSFSTSIGRSRAAPWGGHSGYPDGHIDKNFVQLPEGRKLLFTRMRTETARRLGLRVELRNSLPRLWVNGEEQPFEDAVGNLPLRAGENTVLLELPDGGKGRLFVQADPPSVTSMAAAARGSVAPDLRASAWIWAGDTRACYVRRSFKLTTVPKEARLAVSAFSGYRLFVNGVKIEEEIGPWANWRRPETFTITRYLQPGENVIAVWGQLFAGQNVNKGSDAFRSKGIVLALGLRAADGTETSLVTDASWKGTIDEHEGWERPGFDESDWQPATVCGRMGEAPWGLQVINNIGAVTEPRRPLSIHLTSPYLECFDEVPDLIYDSKAEKDRRVGWYRFSAPPGLRALTLNTKARAQVWVDGVAVEVRDGQALVKTPPRDVSTVAMRLEMVPGSYAGAAFEKPIGLTLGGGRMKPGLWADAALPTYSGIGVYRQTVSFSREEIKARTRLDLGQVLVAAEVLVNGTSAGVRLARPFTYDLTGLLREGDNVIEVRVANTIAPHYTTIPALHIGPTDSGLLGPVQLYHELPAGAWARWARSEVARLEGQLRTVTPELAAAQRQWEKTARWQVLTPEKASSSRGTALKVLADGSVLATGARNESDTYTVSSTVNLEGLRAARIELLPHDSLPERGPGRTDNGNVVLTGLGIVATPLEQRRHVGRIVRIEIVDRPEHLALAEVQVFSGEKNVARQGVARQSTTSAGGLASLALDGNTDGRFFQSNSVTHTDRRNNPWWEVDLGIDAPIDRITIWNRTDQNLQERLQGFRVSVLDASRRSVWQRLIQEPPNPSLTLYLGGPVPLTLSEAVATFSQDGFPASAAIDGQPDSGWGVLPRAGERHAIIVAFPGLTTFKKGTLSLSLAQELGSEHTLGRFRIAVTRSPLPLHDIPARVDRLLALAPAGRSVAQQRILEQFYLSIAPALKPARERLKKLKAAME